MDSWGLDLAFSAYRKMLIHTLCTSVEVRQNSGLLEFYYAARPIRKVEVCGVIVSKTITPIRTNSGVKVIFLVDDFSGIIECIKFMNDSEAQDFQLSLGDSVCVRGLLTVYQSKLDIQAYFVDKVTEPSREIFHCLQSIKLNNENYSQSSLFLRHRCSEVSVFGKLMPLCHQCLSTYASDPFSRTRILIIQQALRLETRHLENCFYPLKFTSEELMSDIYFAKCLEEYSIEFNNGELNPQLYCESLLLNLASGGILFQGSLGPSSLKPEIEPNIDDNSNKKTDLSYTLLSCRGFFQIATAKCESELFSDQIVDENILISRLCQEYDFVSQYTWMCYLDFHRALSS